MHVSFIGEDRQRKISPMALCQRMLPKTAWYIEVKGPTKFSHRNVQREQRLTN
uniref:Uncharacterized protein n=1 Tax=Setaria italica TaxID=4555 RepID=K3ZZ09_SETIT